MLPTVLIYGPGLLLAHIATARGTDKGLCMTVHQFRGYFYWYMAARTGSEVVNLIQHGLSGSEVVYFIQHGLSGSEVVLVAEHGPAGSEVPILYF